MKPVHLEITLKPGAWVDPALYIKQIADAGYAARKEDIRLTLTGKVLKEGDRLVLLVEDVKPGPQRFLLEQATSKDAQEAKALADAFAVLQGMTGGQVEVEGWWRAPKEKAAPAMLLVRRAISRRDHNR